MSDQIPLQILSDDDDDDDSFKTPVPNNQKKRPRSSNIQPEYPIDTQIIDIVDTPQSNKLHKSASSTLPSFVPETPFSDSPKRPIFRSTPIIPDPPSTSTLPGVGELIPVESDDDSEGGWGRETCWKNMGSCAGFDVGVDFDNSARYSPKQKQWGDDALSADLDAKNSLDNSKVIDSTGYFHRASQSGVHNKDEGDLGKISSLKDGRNLADFDREPESEEWSKYVIKENDEELGGIAVNSDLECLERSHQAVELTCYLGSLESTKAYDCTYLKNDAIQMPPFHDQDYGKQIVGLEEREAFCKPRSGGTIKTKKKQNKEEQAANRKKSKEEKLRLMEEKKLKKEQEKLQKAALKAEAVKLKELQKSENIQAEIDPKVIQLGKIGGPLITEFGEKKLKYVMSSNPFEQSIVWRVIVPEGMSQLSSVSTDIPYVLLVFEAAEFCKHVNDGSLMNLISSVQTCYPASTICCLTNRLMSYIHKREQDKFKNPSRASDWKRPPVEEVFAKLTTQFANVHSRQCADEAEVAEHVVGLTINLAKCRSRKKLTHLSVNANGCNVPKDCVDRRLILKHQWLKALVSIPKVQPRFAIAIWKKYPTIKSLLSVYLDPKKSVHEKEFLLKDLPTEGLLGNEDRRLGEICSKRVYRILMAQHGSIKTDDVENGADFFTQQ